MKIYEHKDKYKRREDKNSIGECYIARRIGEVDYLEDQGRVDLMMIAQGLVESDDHGQEQWINVQPMVKNSIFSLQSQGKITEQQLRYVLAILNAYIHIAVIS